MKLIFASFVVPSANQPRFIREIRDLLVNCSVQFQSDMEEVTVTTSLYKYYGFYTDTYMYTYCSYMYTVLVHIRSVILKFCALGFFSKFWLCLSTVWSKPSSQNFFPGPLTQWTIGSTTGTGIEIWLKASKKVRLNHIQYLSLNSLGYLAMFQKCPLINIIMTKICIYFCRDFD